MVHIIEPGSLGPSLHSTQSMTARNGILATGNWIVDQVKIIDRFPQQDALANILEQSVANGGSPYNVLKDIAIMQAPMPLEGIGLIGNDSLGDLIVADCQKYGISINGLVRTNEVATSYTDVMTVQGTGRRTFFHNRGANALLTPAHLQEAIKRSNARIFHLGYLLLLDGLDTLDQFGRTGASYLLEQASSLGFKTSADLVSESSERFKQIVPPSLSHIDYLFLNEYEAEKLTGIPIAVGDGVDLEKAEDAAIELLKAGVREWVILHFQRGAMAINRSTGTVYQPAVKIPTEVIKGAAGAGDAFASGVLVGLHEGYPMQECLRLGVSIAASCLFNSTCSDSITPMSEALLLGDHYGYWKNEGGI